ncbi:MAG: hypothetical protein R3C19_15215 [Planctomycetaceae bacterium]
MSITVDGTSDLTSDSSDATAEIVESSPRPQQRRPPTRLVSLVRWTQHVAKGIDQWSHGYVPFLLWLALLFGGIWFPATGFLNHIFGAGEMPNTVFTPHAKPGASVGLAGAVCVIPFCLLFWTWTNLAFLCVMASSMGEVNRWENRRHKELRRAARPEVHVSGNGSTAELPDYRMACTRAFFVYLFTLLNELAVVGSLTPPSGGEFVQSGYTRIAVLSSLLCFIASYRPSFYESMVSKFGTSQDTRQHSDRDSAHTESALSSIHSKPR